MMDGGFFNTFFLVQICVDKLLIFFPVSRTRLCVLPLGAPTLNLQIRIQAWFPVSPAEFGKYVDAA